MKAMDKMMAILKECKPVTYKELVERVGIPRSHVSSYMHRIKKLHEIEESMDGPRKVFKYICASDDKLNLLAQTELRNKAEHLLKALGTIDHFILKDTFNINNSEALCLIGYLLDTNKALISSNWNIESVD